MVNVLEIADPGGHFPIYRSGQIVGFVFSWYFDRPYRGSSCFVFGEEGSARQGFPAFLRGAGGTPALSSSLVVRARYRAPDYFNRMPSRTWAAVAGPRRVPGYFCHTPVI